MRFSTMRQIAFLFFLGALVHGAPQNTEDGRYYPSDEGRYIPDNSGSYVEDRYGNGRYIPDNSGAYTEDPSIYNRPPYSPDESSSGRSFGPGAGRFGGSSGSASNVGNVFASSSGQPVPGPIAGSGVISSGAPAPAAAPVSAFGAVPQYATPAAYNNNRFFRILRQDQQIGEDGYYYLYETENGITGQEEGKLYNRGTDAEALRASGYYTYTGPDNVVYTVNYKADENGFQPEGAHLPTPPPIPDAIARSLEYLRSRGELRKK